MIGMVISEKRLREVAKSRGFETFEAIEERAKEQGLTLATSTIYRLAGNNNWTRDSMHTLCQVLQADPRDFLSFERMNNDADGAIR